jgi:hypothetical protein
MKELIYRRSNEYRLKNDVVSIFPTSQVAKFLLKLDISD